MEIKPFPGVQKPSDDWTAVVEACEDELVFATEVQEAEALEPRNLKEVKSCSDWLLWEKAIEEELGWDLGGNEHTQGCEHSGVKVGLQSKKGCVREHGSIQGSFSCTGLLLGATSTVRLQDK